MTMSPLVFRLVESGEGFLALQPDWDLLQSRQQELVPFLSWEWMYTWWQVFSRPDWQLRIGTLWQAQTLVGILPFYVKKGWLKGLYFLGTGEDEIREVSSEYLDVMLSPVVNPVELFNCFPALVHDVHYCAFVRMLQSARVSSVSAGAIDNSPLSWVCTTKPLGFRYLFDLVQGNWRDILQANTRLRRKLKSFDKLVASQRLTVRICQDEQSRSAMMAELVRLHTSRWQGRGQTGTFIDPQFLHFHESYSARLLARQQLSLIVVFIDTTPVAAVYCFDHGSVRYFYQSGIDPQSPHSPGYLGLFAAIDDAARRDIRYFDFMLGDAVSSYKQDFCRAGESMQNIYYWRRPFYRIFRALLVKAGLQ